MTQSQKNYCVSASHSTDSCDLYRSDIELYN